MMNASKEQLEGAIDTLKAISLSRFPKEPKQRTARARKGKVADSAQPTLPADGMAEAASSTAS